MLQADRQAGMGRDAPHTGQHAGHEARPVERVVPDREGLPQAAEHDLLVGDQPPHAQPVDVDAVDLGAAVLLLLARAPFLLVVFGAAVVAAVVRLV